MTNVSLINETLIKTHISYLSFSPPPIWRVHGRLFFFFVFVFRIAVAVVVVVATGVVSTSTITVFITTRAGGLQILSIHITVIHCSRPRTLLRLRLASGATSSWGQFRHGTEAGIEARGLPMGRRGPVMAQLMGRRRSVMAVMEALSSRQMMPVHHFLVDEHNQPRITSDLKLWQRGLVYS